MPARRGVSWAPEGSASVDGDRPPSGQGERPGFLLDHPEINPEAAQPRSFNQLPIEGVTSFCALPET
jgi:hypothetical protein